MVSVSCFQAGFFESNVCFRSVIVVACDGGLSSSLSSSYYLALPTTAPVKDATSA